MKIEFNGSMGEIATMTLAGLSLVLVVVNAALVTRNQSLQVQVTQRQQTINQGQQFGRLRQGLAQYLANVAASKNDADINALLTRHGITVTAPPAASTSAPAASSAQPGKKP